MALMNAWEWISQAALRVSTAWLLTDLPRRNAPPVQDGILNLFLCDLPK